MKRLIFSALFTVLAASALLGCKPPRPPAVPGPIQPPPPPGTMLPGRE
jgi:hypothetical protein